MWLACEKAGLVGQVIPRKKWLAIVTVATGVLTDKSADDYTNHMERLLMVKVHPRVGVEPRPNGLRLVRPTT